MVLKPWITVVIPSFAGEQWIDAALSSIANEDNDGIEVLLIDGGPTSATSDLAKTFEDRLRLRIFERHDLGSWHAKTNFGVQVAQSDHLCWLGVDDIWLPGRAVEMRKWIASDGLTPLQLSSSVIIDSSGRQLGVWRCPLTPDVDIPSSTVIERLLVQNFIAAPAPVFRRDRWIEVGGLDESLWYTADWDIWLKLAALAPIRYHDAPRIGFRIHGSSLTATGSRDKAEFTQQMETVLDRHLVNFAGRSKSVEEAARASIAVNVAIAAASGGRYSGLYRAACQVIALGPTGIHRYLRDSRIIERVMPRVRARLTGNF